MTIPASWSTNSAANSPNARLELHQSEHLTSATFHATGTLADAETLILHLETRLAAGDRFCLLFHSLGGLQWEREAAQRFNAWWSEHKNTDGCLAIATVCSLSWRSRLLSEYALSRELRVPCRCFRNYAEARDWATSYS